MGIEVVNYNNMSITDAVNHVLRIIAEKDKITIYFLNADCFYIAQKDGEYRDILNSSDLVLPDGIGFSVISKIINGITSENCNGTDFSPIFIERVSEKGYKIYLLGAKSGVAEKAAENVRKIIPGVKIVGTNSGYFSDDAEVIKSINDSGADILFVAMGVPLQEKWIAKHRGELNPRLYLGVGALFDYLSGRIPRAPMFMRKMHLEWMWRIFIEPKRMFKRYIIDGAKLFWIVMKYKLIGQHSALE